MMKRLMQMNQRLKGSKPSTRRVVRNTSLPADLMNKQAEMVKKQQARRATTALAAGSTRPYMTDMQREQARRATTALAAGSTRRSMTDMQREQARRAATAKAASSARPAMTDMQREQPIKATRQYKGRTGTAAASSPANLQEQIAAAQSTKMMPSYMISRKRMAKGGMTKKGKSK